MAVANHEIQVTWSSSNSASVSGGATAASDAMSFSASGFDAMVTLKAENNGTPVSGDTVDFYALLSCGDPDGSGSDEFPNDDSNGIFLVRLDTYADDPAVATVTIPVAKSVKIFARNNASSNSVTVSACLNEKTA
ncbi:MAG TPA: hypothetical protein PLU87_09725 [Sedimentisphaerales bacterium]|nr:hypothetical protein [Sedimentisphaerales bacterium]HRS11492.1 hypothetical protein [Sedimentisphaerales bacterium]HRV47970.1 hypothetical protein [Sedimentisphaerales bacterium]